MKYLREYLKDLKPGDEVVVRYRTGRVTHGVSNDRNEPAVVVSRGRVNVAVQSRKTARRWNLRLDNGQERRESQMYGWILLTPEYLADEKRERETMDLLRTHGLTPQYDRSPWYGREAHLVTLLRDEVERARTEALTEDAARGAHP